MTLFFSIVHKSQVIPQDFISEPENVPKVRCELRILGPSE